MRFSVGLNYWPRLQGASMWRIFDEGEIREDMARIAALGLDTVRFFIRWDDFQPEADRMSTEMLQRLQRFVTCARDASLDTMPVLLCGQMAGENLLPPWARDGSRAGNIYSEPLLCAQVLFAAEVARAIGNDGVAAWDLSHRFSSVRSPKGGKLRTGGHETAPASEALVAQWARALSRAVAAHSNRPITIGTYSADLTEDRDVRLTSLDGPLAFASMQGSSISEAFARNRLDPEVVPFLAFVASAFSHKLVMVTAFGAPTCPPNKLSLFERLVPPGEPGSDAVPEDDPLFSPFACLTEDEAAAYCTATLRRLHADGRLGAYWWCWADYAGAGAEESPFRRAPHERAYGIIRSDGSAKPIADALTAFARVQPEVLSQNDMPMIGAEYFYRTLPNSIATVYDAFLRHVEERRPI